MAKREIELTVPHKLKRDEALARTLGLLSGLKQKHKGQISVPQEEWHGIPQCPDYSSYPHPTCFLIVSYRGSNASGKLEVTDKDVRLSGTLPSADRFASQDEIDDFKNRILREATEILK